MEPGSGLPQRRAGGGGLDLGAGSAAGSPALSGAQSRRRKQPPRPADFKLQVIIIGSRGVGKTSLMERFTDDTFCEACKSTVGKGAERVPSRPGGGGAPPPSAPGPGRGNAGLGAAAALPRPLSRLSPSAGPLPACQAFPPRPCPSPGGAVVPVPFLPRVAGLGVPGWVPRPWEAQGHAWCQTSAALLGKIVDVLVTFGTSEKLLGCPVLALLTAKSLKKKLGMVGKAGFCA